MKRRSASAVWTKEVQNALSVEAEPIQFSVAELKYGIMAISEELKRPMPSSVRLDLIERRAALRKQLIQKDSPHD